MHLTSIHWLQAADTLLEPSIAMPMEQDAGEGIHFWNMESVDDYDLYAALLPMGLYIIFPGSLPERGKRHERGILKMLTRRRV